MCSICLRSLMRSLVMMRIVSGFCALVAVVAWNWALEPSLARFLFSHADCWKKIKWKSLTCLFIHSPLIIDPDIFVTENQMFFTPVWLQKDFHLLRKCRRVSGSGVYEHSYWIAVWMMRSYSNTIKTINIISHVSFRHNVCYSFLCVK